MKGAPAKPMSGVSPSISTVAAMASRMGSRALSVSSGRARTSSRVRTGRSRTGPLPGTMSTLTPASFMGITMSEKKMPASTLWRRTGCTVISAASSGVRQASSMGMPSRTRRYSGRERPAWRMNQTGRWLEGRPVRAWSMGEDAAVPARRGCCAGRCASCSSVSRGRCASVGCVGRVCEGAELSAGSVCCWFSLIVSSVTGFVRGFYDTLSRLGSPMIHYATCQAYLIWPAIQRERGEAIRGHP